MLKPSQAPKPPIRSYRWIWWGVVGVGLTLGVQACALSTASAPPPPPTMIDTSPSPTASPLPNPEGLWVQPGVPQPIQDALETLLETGEFILVSTAEEATVRLVLTPGPEALLTTRWVLVPVAPFATIPDELSWEAFERYWLGDLDALTGFERPRLVLSPDVVDLLATRWGPPSPEVPLELIESDALGQRVWDTRPALSIVPFEQLTPLWKVLRLDGQSVLDRTMDVDAYPLTVDVGLVAEGESGMRAAELLTETGVWQATNRDPSQMTVVVVTGVTAMARATAHRMELSGYTFPAEEIRPFFADADILHTSNEVAFATDCPEPDPFSLPIFCSQPEYLALLQDIGLDVVELTGNHVNDWDTPALDYTLDLYDTSGIIYYGGGRDLTDAAQPAILTSPAGLRVAFVGCNSAGPYSAWATDDSPGANPCGDWTAITEQIRALRAQDQADVVIATLQYVELPRYDPSPQQIVDFQRLADAGADIVSGSQAHQPQGFALTSTTFIHYGVGNLFFDQMDDIENRQMFADKHIFYNGRHISTVLFTGMMEHWSQPRPMTPEERQNFLRLIFQVSGW